MTKQEFVARITDLLQEAEKKGLLSRVQAEAIYTIVEPAYENQQALDLKTILDLIVEKLPDFIALMQIIIRLLSGIKPVPPSPVSVIPTTVK